MPTVLTDADKVLRNDTGKDIVTELQNLVAAVKPDAEDIPYDNTTSGLTADDVQNAIDELQGNINSIDASSVPYDNTSSGLTADDVQEAIDEIKEESLDKTTSTVTENTTNVNDVVLNSLIKKNGMVQLDFSIHPKALTSLRDKALATIPADYRPTVSFYASGTLIPVETTLSKTMAIQIQISSTGYIRCPNNGAYEEIGAVTTSTVISVHCCYFT